MQRFRTLAFAAAGATLFGIASPPGALAQSQSGPAYLVVEIDVKDQDGFSEYAEKVPATIAQYGGTVLVGRVPAETIEGSAPHGNIVIVKFDNSGAAKEWMSSEEYGAIKEIRLRTADTKAYLVEGLPEE